MAVHRGKSHGKWVWQARVFYHGRRKAINCATYAEARAAERRLLEQFEAEAAREAEAAAAPATLRMLFAGYLANLANRGKGPDTVGRAATTAKAVERLLPDLLARPVSLVSDADVYAFARARAEDGAAPGTINRDLRTLRAMLKWARPGYRFPGAAFLPSDDTRVRWLRPEEEILVLEMMPSPFREVAKLAALTLMRQGELRTLRREMVHLEQGVVLLPRAKGGARPVILSAQARTLLQHHLETHASDWVFPGPDDVPYSRVHVSRVFRKAARAAGLRDFRFHDLRHHGATMALNAGFTAPIVMALGGWKSEAMMRRYAAVTDPTLRAAAEAISGTEQWHRAAKSPSPLSLARPSQG